jgi:predicted small lipoprotein YifL
VALFKPRQLSLMITLLLLIACGQQGPLVPAETPVDPEAATVTISDADATEPTP